MMTQSPMHDTQRSAIGGAKIKIIRVFIGSRSIISFSSFLSYAGVFLRAIAFQRFVIDKPEVRIAFNKHGNVSAGLREGNFPDPHNVVAVDATSFEDKVIIVLQSSADA